MQNVPVGKYSCVKLLLEKSFHSSYSLVFNNSLNKFSKEKVHTQRQPSHFRMSLFCRFYFPWESIVHFMSHSLYQFSRSSEWLVKIRAASLVTSYEIWPMEVSIVSCFSPHGCKILLVQDHIIPVCVPEQWKMSKLFLQKYFKSNQWSLILEQFDWYLLICHALHPQQAVQVQPTIKKGSKQTQHIKHMTCKNTKTHTQKRTNKIGTKGVHTKRPVRHWRWPANELRVLINHHLRSRSRKNIEIKNTPNDLIGNPITSVHNIHPITIQQQHTMCGPRGNSTVRIWRPNIHIEGVGAVKVEVDIGTPDVCVPQG